MAVQSPPKPEQTNGQTQPGTSPSPLPAPEQKHAYVQGMFDAIAPRYDLLNSVLSARLHHGWRRIATRQAALKPGNIALDVCTGTADFAFELARHTGKAGFVWGTDFSLGMLKYGEHKRQERNLGGTNVRLALADTQALPFASNTFDAVTVGFGIRNVADVQAGINEMARVAKPGGRVVILEFTQPQNPVFGALYRFYSFRVLPLLGGLLSPRKSAYEYLPSSVEAFHTREGLADVMRRAGLQEITVRDLTFGVVAIHRGVKPL